MKELPANYIVFDIGSNKIAAIAANISKTGETNVIAQVLHHSSGFKGGTIVNLPVAENSIIEAVYVLEKECEKRIKEVSISLSGKVKSYYISHSLKLSSQAITTQDVKKIVQKALADFSIKDQEIIQYFPIEFTLDKNNVVENPVGMYAKEISIQLHVITANSIMLRNLINCFAKCHIEVGGVMLSIFASGLSCLSEDEKETGAIVIDMGSHITSFGVFWGGKLLYVGNVPMGSHHITIDIAKSLSVSLTTAEKLKILYGDVRYDVFNKNESIRISDFEPYNDYNPDRTISALKLAEIIRPRIEEILKLLKKEYDHISMDHLIAKRIVLTGGGSGLYGIKNLVAEIFQKQVKIAKPELVPGFIENYNISMYQTALGMIKSKALKHQKNPFKPGQLEDLPWFKRAYLWFRENI